MAIFIPCPGCGKDLVGGVLAPCPGCGWTAQPQQKQAVVEEAALQFAQLLGRFQRSRIRAWIIAFVSLLLNVLLSGALIFLLVH